MDLCQLTVIKALQGLRKKEFSALELTQAFLNKIAQKDKEIRSYITITDSLALSQAKAVDDLISAKKELPALAGIPLAIKDNILIEGVKTTCASKILENYTASYDATCIKKLKEAGAVFLGKTNLDEFTMGGSTENSAFFTTKNPKDPSRVPGGSSGGSAAAVAADLCCAALGSDTGGSIRQPASFCGVVGLKPTYGAISRYGLVAFASSLDQIGPIAKTAEDAEILFDVIKGWDEHDSTSINLNPKSQIPNPKKIPNPKSKIKNLRIGVPKEYFVKGIDKEVEKIIQAAIKKFEDLGAKIMKISLPHTEYALATYYLIATSEASANLARYDGIKYGLSEEGTDLLAGYLKTRGNGFGREVKRRIMLGVHALSSGYYDAYYLKAQQVRTLIKKDFEEAFKKIDVIFTPVSPFPAFKIGEKTGDPLLMYLADIYTVSVNLAGLPAISVPVGSIGALPVGPQIIGRPLEETKILALSKILEQK